jgi:rhamnosyltransferase
MNSINKKKKNIYFIQKKNRGRDISALLVSFRKEILKYEVICFMHDKKEKVAFLKNEIEQWTYNLWENMLGSTDYITNILYTFQRNKEFGLLVPPATLGKRITHAYKNQWQKNYHNTVRLAESLNLKVDIDLDNPPITLGTMFWAKTDALRKLFEKEWKYEDFEEEPLPDDGTLSHAVERIFAYVCQDAGYDTEIVMTDIYASDYIENALNTLSISMKLLNDKFGINYIFEIEKYYLEQKRMRDFFAGKRNVYIYGAGDYGISCLKLLNDIDLKPSGFIVTQKDKESDYLMNNRIWDVNEVELEKEDGVIIAVNYQYREEIMKLLRGKKNFLKENGMIFSKIELIGDICNE